MSVARTCARKRKQTKLDPRYKVSRPSVSAKLQGRAKLQAQQDASRNPKA